MTSKDVASGSYRKITLDTTSESDKLSVGVPTVTKKDADIDGVCELQLTSETFADLKTKLQTALAEKLQNHKSHETEHLGTSVGTVAQELTTASNTLNNSKQAYDDLIKTLTSAKQDYDNLIQSLTTKKQFFETMTNSFSAIEGDAGKALTSAVTRTNQQGLIEATKQIKDEIKKAKATFDKQIKDEIKTFQSTVDKKIKDQIKKTDDIFDKLNGTMVSGSVFAKTDAAIETLKKSSVKTDIFLEDIDLINTAKPLRGVLYTSGWRVTNRNIPGLVGTLTKVNAKKKEYTVSYKDTAGKDQTIVVNQKDLCQVNDDKIKAKLSA